MTTAVRKIEVSVCKVEQRLGLVFGYALICATKNASGEFEPYFDQGSYDETGALVSDHVSEDEMLSAVTDFMQSAERISKMNHAGDQRGVVVHSFPLTAEIAKALDIDAKMTGWLVAMKPDAEMLAKFVSGELTGFSIGGRASREEVTP